METISVADLRRVADRLVGTTKEPALIAMGSLRGKHIWTAEDTFDMARLCDVARCQGCKVWKSGTAVMRGQLNGWCSGCIASRN